MITQDVVEPAMEQARGLALTDATVQRDTACLSGWLQFRWQYAVGPHCSVHCRKPTSAPPQLLATPKTASACIAMYSAAGE